MSSNEQAHHEKARAAVSSVLWSLFLTGIKVWAGVATNSLGILSEALHSGLDFFAAAMTFYAVRVAAIPPDQNHPYGHEKVENLSALVETALLVLTCVWITWEAIRRLVVETPEINLTWWAFAVVAISLLVDINRSAMLRRVAKKHNSQALEADALHFTTDIWSSAVVLLGLVCVWLAGWTQQGGTAYNLLLRADAIAALAVAAIILKVSWNLSKKSIHALMDGSSDKITDAVRDTLAQQLPGFPVLSIRSRDIGSKVHVELTVGMPSELHVDDAHALTERVESIIDHTIPQAEVIVHIEPRDFIENHTDDGLAAHIALKYDIRIHSFRMANTPKGRLLSIDVELPEETPLGEAYPVIHSFEEELIKALGLYKLVVRVEPICRAIPETPSVRQTSLSREDMETICMRVVQSCPQIESIDSIDLDDLESACSVVVNAVVSGNLSVGESHELASTLEHHLHHALPLIPDILVILRPRIMRAPEA